MLRKLFKPIMATVLTISVLLSAGVPVMASSDKHFSKDTVITESNMNDVLKAHNIDPSLVVKNPAGTVDNIVTVGDFEAILDEAKKQPKKIHSNDSGLPTAGGLPNASLMTASSYTGASTASRATRYTETLIVNYYAAGYATNGMWTYPVSSNWTPGPTNIATAWWTVVKTYTNHLFLYSGGTIYAYLQLSYSYDITNYIGVGGYGIPTNTIGITGTINFSNSYI